MNNKNVNFKCVRFGISPNFLTRRGVEGHYPTHCLFLIPEDRCAVVHCIISGARSCYIAKSHRVWRQDVRMYTACSILLRWCARIRIARIFFLFISTAWSLFNGSWNGAYLHTLFKYSPLKYPYSAYIMYIYIYAQRQNIYALYMYNIAAVSGSSLRPLLQCPKMSTWVYIYIYYILLCI